MDLIFCLLRPAPERQIIYKVTVDSLGKKRTGLRLSSVAAPLLSLPTSPKPKVAAGVVMQSWAALC
jgi:hypothetical protein